MAELMLIRQGDTLRPMSSEDLEVLRKFPHGKPLRGKVTSVRNYQFHKKAFSLMSLAFQYWVPKDYISNIEKRTVTELCKFLVRRGVDQGSTNALCGEFMSHLNNNRSQMEGIIRSFDEFRKWLTVEAGFFDVVITPSGLKKIPKSISFANMEETEFGDWYKAIFDVCWGLCLGANFKNQTEVESAAAQLLGYS